MEPRLKQETCAHQEARELLPKLLEAWELTAQHMTRAGRVMLRCSGDLVSSHELGCGYRGLNIGLRGDTQSTVHLIERALL